MTDTALIGSSSPLGAFWTSKRYFDYMIDETNLSLLSRKERKNWKRPCWNATSSIP